MKNRTKIWLSAAVFLVLSGIIIIGGIMSMSGWDFSKFSTAEYETNTHEVNEEYQNFSINTKTADIEFVASEDGKTSVVCREEKKVKHSVTVKEGSLVIECVDTRKWYEHIGINFQTPKITVYIPQGEYGALSLTSVTGNVEISKDFKFKSIDISENTGAVTNYASAEEGIKIKTTTGSIRIENISAGTLDLSVTTGRITVSSATCTDNVTVNVSTGKTRLSDISCKSLSSRGSTGDIHLESVTATEKLWIKRSTGDVKFDGCDASEIFVKTDTGDVTGNFLTDKVFLVQTDTGDVTVPKSVSGGKCEITTDTGDIRFK